MVKVTFTAKIEWIEFEEGGRRTPPSKGTKYCPIIKFDNITLPNEWSVCFICTEERTKSCTVEMSFLSDTPPDIGIEANSTFGLFEGNRKVAKGKVMCLF